MSLPHDSPRKMADTPEIGEKTESPVLLKAPNIIITTKVEATGRQTHLLSSLAHRQVSLDVGLQERVEVVLQAVLFGQRRHARLHGPQVVPRQLGEEVV